MFGFDVEYFIYMLLHCGNEYEENIFISIIRRVVE